MRPLEILSACRDLGLELRAEDGLVKVSGASRLTPELVDAIREQKAALLEALSRVLWRCASCRWMGGGPSAKVENMIANHRATGHRVEVLR